MGWDFYDHRKLVLNMVFPFLPSGDGEKQESSKKSDQTENIEDTLTSPSQKKQSSNEDVLPIAGSVLQNKRTISTDRSNHSKKRTRTTKSSRTLDQALISGAKTCYGWWTQSCVEMSKKLLLPTKIDYADSLTNLSHGYVTEQRQSSLCKTKICRLENKNSPKISWPSSMFSAADITECADMKVQKIRLKPSPEQAKILRTWMKAARWTYNAGLELVKQKKAKPNLGLKKLTVTRRKEDNPEVCRIKDAPADIRVGAIRDLIKTFNSAHAGYIKRKQKQKTYKNRWKKRKKTEKLKGRRRFKSTKPFEVKFKSKRLTKDSFSFEKKSITVKDKSLFLFSSCQKFGMKRPILMTEHLKHPITTDCRVSYSFGRWYVLVPFSEHRASPETKSEIRVVALDPGVRSFTTYFASDGTMGELGCDMQNTSDKLQNKIESIRNRIKQSHGKLKKKLNKAWYRCNARSEDIVSNFHWHTIKFLLDEYDVVIAPRLATSYMLSGKSKLNHTCKHTMRFQRHGKFLERLKMKAKFRNKIHLDVEEHGTSMTCSSCGNINRKLGSSKVYHCVECGLSADRDLNSAKNHLIKATCGNTNY
jgi:putative transposase